jgi:phage anti-repressor protein
MVEHVFGYKKHKDMMRDFSKNIKKYFEENIDYKSVDKTHELVVNVRSGLYTNKDLRGGNNKKYYIITGETFKALLMTSQMPIGKQTRKYYIKVETLGITTTNIITDCINIMSNKQIEELTKVIELKSTELSESKRKLIKLNEFVKVAQELKKEEIFYIATTDLYAKNNRFKYGGIITINDLNNRLNNYNIGRAEGDLFYFVKVIKCHKYKHIENCIDMLLKGFKDKVFSKKEMVHMRYPEFIQLIEFILENHNKDIEFINEHGKRFLQNTINLEPVLPQPLDMGDYVIIKRRKNGYESELQKINVSDWSEDKVQDLLKRLVSQYATIKLGTEYDFDTQKNSHSITLIWKDFKHYLDQYSGKNTMGWRNCIKDVCIPASKLTIRWKV